MKNLLFSLFLASCAFGQTETQSPKITGTLDASAAIATTPNKSGLSASIPATCAVGQTYFKTDAVAGSNTFACTATNVWTAQGGGGSGLPSDAGKPKQGLTSDGAGLAAWKPVYQYFTLPIATCLASTLQWVASVQSVTELATFTSCPNSINNDALVGTTSGSTFSFQLRYSLPDTFVSGSTATVWFPKVRSDTGSGNNTYTLASLCDPQSVTYNTATSVIHPNGAVGSYSNVTFTGVDMTGCAAMSTVTFLFRSANTGVTVLFTDGGGKVQVNTY